MTENVQQPNDLRVCQQILAGNRSACTWPDCACPKHPADASSNSAATHCPNCGEPIKFEGEHWEQGGYFCRAIPNHVSFAAGRADRVDTSDPDDRAGRLDIRKDSGSPGRATPNRAQAQTSLTDQIGSVLELATNRGYYDAADWIIQVWRQWGKRG